MPHKIPDEVQTAQISTDCAMSWPKKLYTRRIVIGGRLYGLCRPESRMKNYTLVNLEVIVVIGLVQHSSQAMRFCKHVQPFCRKKLVLPTIYSSWEISYPKEVHSLIIMFNRLSSMQDNPQIDEVNFRRLGNYVRDDFVCVNSAVIACAEQIGISKDIRIVVANADKGELTNWGKKK